MQVPQIYRILPELWLTVTGVLIMLIEPLMPPGMTRKPIGILALVGVVGALLASIWQLGLPPGTAFYGTVQTDAFSVFFHVLICGIVLIALLIAFDVFDGSKERPAEYYALVLFGAMGMCLMPARSSCCWSSSAWRSLPSPPTSWLLFASAAARVLRPG